MATTKATPSRKVPPFGAPALPAAAQTAAREERRRSSLKVGDLVRFPANGRVGIVVDESTHHPDGTERKSAATPAVAATETSEAVPAKPSRSVTAYAVAWLPEVSDPIDPEELEAL